MKEIIKQCPNCGKHFTATRKDKLYCSLECKEAFTYQKRRGGKKATTKCPICGKKFTVSNKHRVYCSADCRLKAKDLQQKARQKNQKEKLDKIRASYYIKHEKEFDKIVELARQTGLSYGQVRSMYPDIEKIEQTALYLGKTGYKKGERKKVGSITYVL